jgi:hypothetical protein
MSGSMIMYIHSAIVNVENWWSRLKFWKLLFSSVVQDSICCFLRKKGLQESFLLGITDFKKSHICKMDK